MDEARNTPARRSGSRRRSSAVDRVRKTDFPVAMRGYDRAAVDRYVAEVAQLVAELETTQTREGVVQRALDEVGEQTSGILQHAHDTAEEITSSSRSQAEGRLQRAEQEAEETRRDADRYAEQVVEDTRRLWQDRQRLIEDLRQLADEVLNVSDDALDRLEQPNTEFAAEEAGYASAEDDPEPEQEPAAGPDAAQEPPEPDPTAVWSLPAEDPEDTTVESAVDEPRDHTTSEFEAPAARERAD
jgi:cell division initiation protein